MIDLIFFVLLALTATQPGHGDLQVELYTNGELRYRTIAQPIDSGYILSVLDSALELRQVARITRDDRGFEVLDEGGEEPRRIDFSEEIPGWTKEAISKPNFIIETEGGEIRGTRAGPKLTLTLDSDIDLIKVQPYRD